MIPRNSSTIPVVPAADVSLWQSALLSADEIRDLYLRSEELAQSPRISMVTSEALRSSSQSANAYNFGLRKGELLRMRVGDVDLVDKSFRLPPGTTKNDKGRTIKMTDDVHELLKTCVQGKKFDEAVFTWEDGSPVRDFRVSWSKMCDAAGVEILLHDFRRTAIRNMIRAGVSKLTAMRLSGHFTSSVFDRYDIGDVADLEDAATKLQERRRLVTESREAK